MSKSSRITHILLIDDDQDFLEVATDGLTRAGFTVTATTQVQDVWGLFKGSAKKIDAVVCDVQMPDESGTGLVSRIRAMGVSIPVVLITGHFDIDSDAAKVLGADDILTKPFEMKSLVAMLKEQLELSRAKSA